MALPQQYSRNLSEKDFYTEDEYFEFERTAFGRWEFVPTGPSDVLGRAMGEIRAMSGGKDDHNAIAGNVVRALGNALVPRGCRVYGSDMKVHCGDGTNTFPDVAVVCGARQYHRGRTDVILNPMLVVEVLSDSTEGYDRGEKFDHYRTVPSLVDYLLVEQDAARVMLFTRADGHWDFRETSGAQAGMHLPSVDVTLSLADVYALIEFVEMA